jgi:hypothetical protein
MAAVRKRNEGEKRKSVCIFILDYRSFCEEIGLAVTFRHICGWSTLHFLMARRLSRTAAFECNCHFMESFWIELYLRHCTQDEIAMILKTGHTRVSRAIREFKISGIIHDTLRIGRPQRATSELAAFIEARTIQQPWLAATRLSDHGIMS